MDCTLIQVELIAAYHFGGLDGAEYDAVEAHLVECTECLRAYMRMKRHLERAPARPSDELRRRLRDDVELEFRPKARERARRWFARPIPLYQGLAVAAVVALLVAVMPAVARRAEPPSPGGEVAVAPVPAPAQRVDTSRHDAENLAFY
jgi:anti-sigma factor RsiW